jgi:hypothetical protein
MVADALYQDDDRSDEELINILHTHCPSQLPQHYKIVPLPSKITSWLTSLLLWLPVKQQLVEKHTRTKLGHGTNTPNGVNNADSARTYSSTDSPDSTKPRSWAPLLWLSMKDGFLDKAMIPWLKKSVSDTLNFVAATFQEHGCEDPQKDVDNNVARLLCQQLRSYKKDNPKSMEQKALPLCVICLILSNRLTELQRLMGDLTAAAHFWAMRSCEYLKVTKAEQGQTKQFCLQNIAFIENSKILNHSSTKLHLADCISVTFVRQKNDRKSDTVMQWRTKDPILCPKKVWASIVMGILLYEGTNKNSPISLVLHRKKLISVTSEMITNLIQDGMVATGETKLGVECWEIGTHLIRSGVAMAMYLAGVPIFSIMLIGRWSSMAFLKYNWKQVQEFLHGILSKMIQI